MDHYFEDLNLKSSRKLPIFEKMMKIYFESLKAISTKLQTHVNRMEVTKKNTQSYHGFRIYADGSHNPGTRGTATSLIMREGLVVGKVWDCDLYASSLVAELAAVILGLEETPLGASVQVYTDCSSVVVFYKMLTDREPNKWRKRYQDTHLMPPLIKLDELMRARFVEVNWVSRKHPLIEWCHKCCRKRISHWNSIQIDKPISRSIIRPRKAA